MEHHRVKYEEDGETENSLTRDWSKKLSKQILSTLSVSRLMLEYSLSVSLPLTMIDVPLSIHVPVGILVMVGGNSMSSGL